MKPMVVLAWLLLDWPVTLTVGVLLIVVGLVGIPMWAWARHHRVDPADLGLSILDAPTEELPQLPGRRRAGRVRTRQAVPVVCCHARPIRSSTTYQAATPRRGSTTYRSSSRVGVGHG